MGYGERIPLATFPEKKRFFYLKWCVWGHSERYFMSVSSPENVECSAWCNMIYWTLKYITFGNTLSRVMAHGVGKLFIAL